MSGVAASDPIDRIRAEGAARESAMRWAMQTARIGEDAMAILARAELYEEYVLAPINRPSIQVSQLGIDRVE